MVLGVLFFGHGTQKLFSWFDSHGLEAPAQAHLRTSVCVPGAAALEPELTAQGETGPAARASAAMHPMSQPTPEGET